MPMIKNCIKCICKIESTASYLFKHHLEIIDKLLYGEIGKLGNQSEKDQCNWIIDRVFFLFLWIFKHIQAKVNYITTIWKKTIMSSNHTILKYSTNHGMINSAALVS